MNTTARILALAILGAFGCASGPPQGDLLEADTSGGGASALAGGAGNAGGSGGAPEGAGGSISPGSGGSSPEAGGAPGIAGEGGGLGVGGAGGSSPGAGGARAEGGAGGGGMGGVGVGGAPGAGGAPDPLAPYDDGKCPTAGWLTYNIPKATCLTVYTSFRSDVIDIRQPNSCQMYQVMWGSTWDGNTTSSASFRKSVAPIMVCRYTQRIRTPSGSYACDSNFLVRQPVVCPP